MQTALMAGMSISDFWESTPREIDIVIQAHIESRKEAVALAWLNAAWQRCKKLPSLSSVIGTEKVNQTPEQMLEFIKHVNKKLGGKVW